MHIEIKKIKSIEVKDGRICVETDGALSRVEIEIKEITKIGFDTKQPENEEEKQ